MRQPYFAGEPHHSEYVAYVNMVRRCVDPRHPNYRWYGARGITVCDRWRHSFAAFLADVGPKPSPGLWLDRIDNDGDYEPGNVRWCTPGESARNRRATAAVTRVTCDRCGRSVTRAHLSRHVDSDCRLWPSVARKRGETP